MAAQDPVALVRRYQKNVSYSELQEMAQGWCQFELTVNVLMGGHAPVIMVQGLGSAGLSTLDRTATIKRRTREVLHYAAARSDKEAVARLLGICEPVEAQTRLAAACLTALHLWAAFSFNEEIARLLVANTAQVDRRASGGLTPLMMSCRTGNLSACRMLLQMVPSLLNARADVSYSWAGLSLDINTVCHLQRWSRAGPYLIWGELRSATLRRLFSLGQGSTPVLAAAALGNAKVVEVLSRAGAEMTSRNASGLDIHEICRVSQKLSISRSMGFLAGAVSLGMYWIYRDGQNVNLQTPDHRFKLHPEAASQRPSFPSTTQERS
eukprot:Skav234178  [mRNA]  locus=scaffold1377:43231:53588:- [translate_table: standard]